MAPEETPSQKQLVYQEIDALWSHAHRLFKEENFDLAIALLRSRLKDPHAYLPSPANGSVDELSVMGYYFLALALDTVVRLDNLFDMPKDDELLDALRRARDGLVRYGYNKGTQATVLDLLASKLVRRDETLESNQVHRQLAAVLREMNEEDPMRTDPMSENGEEAMPLDRLAGVLQSLASGYSSVFQHREAVNVMEEACEVLKELEEGGRMNPALHVIALCLRAKFMEAAGIKGSNIFAKQAATTFDEAIELIVENTAYAINEMLDNSDEMTLIWVLMVTTLDKSLGDEEWGEVFGGKSRREILMLAKERAVRAAKIPSNLRDGLPADWENALAFAYFTSLESLSSKLDSAQEEVAMLEKALEIQLIQGPQRVPEFLRLPNRLPEDFSYSEFIKLFDWDNLTSASSASHLIVFLPKLGAARLKLLKQLEMEGENFARNTDAYDACMAVMAQEIEYGLNTARKYSKSPPTEEARKAMEVAKGELLMLKGRMITRQKERKEEARQYWKDARDAFISVEGVQTNGLDTTEKGRLDNLKLAEDLLSGAIEP